MKQASVSPMARFLDHDSSRKFAPMKSPVVLLVSLLGFFALTGCATILSGGGQQTIRVDSNVEGAAVFLDGRPVGVTPFYGSVRRGGAQLMVQAEGYKSEYLMLATDLSGLFWVNCLSAGIFGSVTDVVTGAAYVYAPSQFQIDLVAEGQSTESFRKEVEVRSFALTHYPEIVAEVSASERPYSTVLIALIGSSASETESHAWLREAISRTASNRQEFGALAVTRIGS